LQVSGYGAFVVEDGYGNLHQLDVCHNLRLLMRLRIRKRPTIRCSSYAKNKKRQDCTAWCHGSPDPGFAATYTPSSRPLSMTASQ